MTIKVLVVQGKKENFQQSGLIIKEVGSNKFRDTRSIAYNYVEQENKTYQNLLFLECYAYTVGSLSFGWNSGSGSRSPYGEVIQGLMYTTSPAVREVLLASRTAYLNKTSNPTSYSNKPSFRLSESFNTEFATTGINCEWFRRRS